MKIKVNAVAPVFAWNWDTRNETEIDHDIKTKKYPYIVNSHQRLSSSQEETSDIQMNNNHSQVSNASTFEVYEGPKVKGEELEIQEDEDDEDEDEENDVCGICRANYNGTCPTCKIPGDTCPLVIGDCKHYFHYHCIIRWLRTSHSKGLCPMCRRQFILKVNYPINDPIREKFNKIMIDLVNKHVEEGEDIGFWVGTSYENNISPSNNDFDEDEEPLSTVVSLYPVKRPFPWPNKDEEVDDNSDISSSSESLCSSNADVIRELCEREEEEDKVLLNMQETDFDIQHLGELIRELHKKEKQKKLDELVVNNFDSYESIGSSSDDEPMDMY